MSEVNVNAPRRVYGKKHRMGTMGILLREGKVLLIHRRLKTSTIRDNGPPDTWSFPGGGVDEGETPEEAIVREFKEEVNLDVSIFSIGDEPVWGETDDFLDDPWRCFIFIVLQTGYRKEPEVMEPHKHVGLQWMAWEDMWASIKATMTNNDKPHSMRFFQTLENMVKKYPNRHNPESLLRRL